MWQIERAEELHDLEGHVDAANNFALILLQLDGADDTPDNRKLEGRAQFGLAYALITQGGPAIDAAEPHFRRCVTLQYKVQESLFWLGRIAKANGQKDLYAAYMAASATVPDPPKPQRDKGRRRRPTPPMLQAASLDQLAVMPLIDAEDNEAARQSIALLRDLAFFQRPHGSAFLDTLLLWVAVPFGLALFAGGILGRIWPPFPILLIAFAILSGIYWFRFIETTEYAFRDGLFILSRGVLVRTTVMTEMFRVHNFEIRQSFLNRLTRDGSIVVVGERETNQPTLYLKGITKEACLLPLALEWRRLNRAMRGTLLVKGIVKS